MLKEEAINIICESAKIYDKYFVSSSLLFIYGIANDLKCIEVVASPSNFAHLVGIVVNTNIDDNSKDRFFQKAISKKLSPNDFDFKDDTTQLKLQVLPDTLNVANNSKMIGDYYGNHLLIETGKITGSFSSCLGLIQRENGYYAPQTVLKQDARENILKGTQRQILAILQKKVTDKEYGKVIYKAKKIGKKKLDFNLLISSFHKQNKDIPLSAEFLSTAVAQKNEKQEKKSILKPYYFEVKNFKEVEKVLDNHGIIHIILPDKKVRASISSK